MDIPRSASSSRPLLKVALGFAALGILAAGYGLSRLEPAIPAVESSGILVDTVRRGTLIRQVRDHGTFVPDDTHWIPATTAGRIERIRVRPGAVVAADTVLLELSNPELEQSALDAQLQLQAAEAEFANLKVRLASELFAQKAQAATVTSDFRQAILQSASNRNLARQGLIPQLTAQLSDVRAEELATRNALEQRRLTIAGDSSRAQLAVQQTRIEQLRTLLALRRRLVDYLKVRAGTAGVLQQLFLDVGQQASPGTNLARVADPRRLKAVLRIAETQAKDIQLGQSASIDTRNGLVPGRVSRIDPAVQNGTVAVEVHLTGALPKGARPDLSVEGTIELERLENVLYIGRPAFGQENGTIKLFKLTGNGQEARRVSVRLGRGSVSAIEILSGLQVGERVILSDPGIDAERIRLQ
jgi:HlyD family secretion protein